MTIQYTLVRSARKSIAISFNEQGELVVKAPLHIETSQIEALLREKAALIERHRRIWQAQKAAQPPEPTLQEQRALSSQARLRLAPLVEKIRRRHGRAAGQGQDHIRKNALGQLLVQRRYLLFMAADAKAGCVH